MDVVTLGAALSIMKKMPDTAASSAAAAEDAADRAEAAAEQAEGAIEVDDTLSIKGRAADAYQTGLIKSALNEIREPGANICSVTPFERYKYTGGVFVSRNNDKQLKIWGSGGSWVRFNLLMGNDEFTASFPNYNTNLDAGTYTLKADNTLRVYYGTSRDDRQVWESGTSITINSAVCVYAQSLSKSESYGTEDNPTLFNIEIFVGDVSIIPTAVDVKARAELATMPNYRQIEEAVGETSYNKALTKNDFDYDKPYNIFNGTTWTANKKIDYLTGSLENSSEGYLATDYMEIDNTKEYLCINIYVQLSGETGEGLVTGANRVWVHQGWAFYDANKQYIRGNAVAEQSATSKSIPPNAKYVRLTINKAAIIPYAVLFYGYFSSGQYVRYRDYRKELQEDDVYSATGMEKLNMVMFGDSITFGYDIGVTSISYIDFANDYLRSNIINCGLGGSRMSQGSPDTIGLGSFASLCENIVSTDADAWDALDAYIESTSRTDWAYQVAKLKAVDWSTIQAIGLWYGANDWHNSVPVGTEYNEDPTKYDGACAYGLKLLLTKYPHLQVIVFTPLFRVIDASHTGDDANSVGLTISDYGASLSNMRSVFHCPVVDSCNELGINRFTIYSYSATNDGTHPRKRLGLERMGRFLAESVKRYIQPY